MDPKPAILRPLPRPEGPELSFREAEHASAKPTQIPDLASVKRLLVLVQKNPVLPAHSIFFGQTVTLS